MSPKTVMHHTGSVSGELGVGGRAEAVAHALHKGSSSDWVPSDVWPGDGAHVSVEGDRPAVPSASPTDDAPMV